MKIYMMTDMEGTSCLDDFDMCDWRNGEPHIEGCRLLAGDIDAAIEGAVGAGATEILVCDAHAGGGNLRQKDLAPPAKLVLPKGSRDYLADLDDSFDACFLIGAHAMAGTARAFIAHTQSLAEWKEYRVNGRPMGEIGQVAILAGALGVPLTLVAGDRKATEEAGALVDGPLSTAAVKEVDESNRLCCLPANDAHDLIRQAAGAAVQRRRTIQPVEVALPAEVTLTCTCPEVTKKMARISGADMLDPCTIRFTAHRAEEILGDLFQHDRWKKAGENST